MIKLTENRSALFNLNTTINALDDIDTLIRHYSEDKPGPAYCAFDYVSSSPVKVQFDRKTILTALNAQRQQLVDYFASLGIEA